MAEPFLFTYGRWYNKLDPETGKTGKVPAYKSGFTYDGFAYGSDTPETFTPGGGVPVQLSLICSKTSFLLVIDIDYPENLRGSATGELISWSDAISTRGSHFHVAVDMRGISPDDWPVQGRTAWGDIKAAGFVAAPGSVHYSGALYAAADNWQARVVTGTPGLLAALNADKTAYAVAKLKEWGAGSGERLPDGSYLYPSGYVGGTWGQLPDGALAHDDELKDLVFDMHVQYGRPEAEVRGQWNRLATALGKPWTDKDFARHWRRVPARRAELLEDDDTLRLEEDFGLRFLPPAWEAAGHEQRTRYEQVPPDGPRPPEPPGDWGFEEPGVDYFTMWLGSGVFDAGRPTDADNAIAVLTRAHNVLRYDEETGAWLLRGTGRWVGFPGADAPRSVIAGLRDMMPAGCADPVKLLDKDPETDGPEIAALKAQAKNMDRFSTSASVGAVARSMTDHALRHRGRGSTVRAGQLDTEPEVLWAGGVPWDLRKTEYRVLDDGRTVPHRVVASGLDRSTPHLMTAPVVPDPRCPTPRWDDFCAAIWPDPQGREWALDVLSVGFTGYADAVMPVLLGDGGLGKTFLVNLLNSVLGDYGGVMHADLLKPDARLHGAYTIKLKGLRLAFVDEAPGRGQASQEHLKKITGGGEMEGNRMRENPVTFTPTHTLVLAANFERMPPMHEDALRRRVRLVKFDGTAEAVKAAANAIGNSPRSPQWQAEIPGVLAAMTARAARWLDDRRTADNDRAPMTWQTWTEAVIAEQDPVLPWLTSGEVTADPSAPLTTVQLHEHCVAWRKRHEMREELSLTRFGTLLTKLGYHTVSRRDANYRPLRIVVPGARDFMQGYGPGGYALQPSTNHPPTLHTPGPDGPETVSSQQGSDPNPPQTVHGQNSSSEAVSQSFVDGCGGFDSHSSTTQTETPPKNSTETALSVKKGCPTPQPSTNGGKRASDLHVDGVEGTIHNRPPKTPAAGPHTAAEADRSDTPSTAQIADSPPDDKTPKKPRAKLTPEERAEREVTRKQKLAEERLRAREEKIAELGGPLVQLPAIVLRDQSIMPVDAATAQTWLEPCLGELSVDVEHSGYGLGHRDYRLRLVQLGNEHSAVVLDPDDEEQAAVITWALANATVLHAHSALADLVPLEAAGLGDRSMWSRMRDTVIAAKLADPALCDSDEAGLKALAKALLGPEYALSWKCDERRKELFQAGGWLTECEVTTPVERSGWAQVNKACETFVRYAGADVMDCGAIARVLGVSSL